MLLNAHVAHDLGLVSPPRRTVYASSPTTPPMKPFVNISPMSSMDTLPHQDIPDDASVHGILNEKEDKLKAAESTTWSSVERLNAELVKVRNMHVRSEKAAEEARAQVKAAAQARAAEAEAYATVRAAAESRAIEAEAAAEANAAKAAVATEARATAEARAAEAEATAEARVAEAAAAAEARAVEAVWAATQARVEALTQQHSEAEEELVAPLHDALVCPMTMELFADPVCTSDGHTYEREAIEEAWRVAREMAEERARGSGDTCGECCADGPPEPFVRRSPCTGAVVTEALISNHLVTRQIEALVQSEAFDDDEAAEWRVRRERALERERERRRRPASAPADVGRDAHVQRTISVTPRPRSASFGRRAASVASAASAAAAYPGQILSRRATRVGAARVQRATARRHAAEENASRAALANFQQCPGCSVHLEKTGGCDHFTCGACDHEFCWRCSAPYHGRRGIHHVGNSAHNRGCPHWRQPGR